MADESAPDSSPEGPSLRVVQASESKSLNEIRREETLSAALRAFLRRYGAGLVKQQRTQIGQCSDGFNVGIIKDDGAGPAACFEGVRPANLRVSALTLA